MLLNVAVMALSAAGTQNLGVMDFGAQGASADLAVACSSVTAHELERLGVFRVSSAESTRVILGYERQRQLLGCDDCSGSALDALTSLDYLVTGKVTKAGSTWLLVLTLLIPGSAQPASSVTVEGSSEEALLKEVPTSVVKLVGKVLQGKQGSLVIASTEVGAAVKIDDTQVGTTPLPGQLPLGAGPHLLSVEKEGFSAVRKEVRISPSQLSEEWVRLVPSPDTIQAYESKAKRLRILAWVATGVAAAGVVTFTAGQLSANGLYGDAQTTSTFSYHLAALQRNVETENGVDHRAEAQRLKGQIETMQNVSWLGAAATAVGAAAATVLFVIGDSPGKYDAFRTSVAPSPSGVKVFGSF